MTSKLKLRKTFDIKIKNENAIMTSKIYIEDIMTSKLNMRTNFDVKTKIEKDILMV